MKEQIGFQLTGKDLITCGIFAAIYFAINMIFMLLGIVPIMWILMPGWIALFAAIPYMLMCAKVQKPGAPLIMGLVTALIYFATGQFTMMILITFALGCILAEVFRAITRYKSFWGNAISYVPFSLGMIGSPLPIWIFRDSFFAQIQQQGMPADYMASLEQFASPAMLIVMIAAPIIGALIGSVITRKMFKKHFVKAGMIAA